MWQVTKAVVYWPRAYSTEISTFMLEGVGFVLVGALPSLELRRVFAHTTRPLLGCSEDAALAPML